MLYLVGASSENDLSILLREHRINYTPADSLSMLLDTLTTGECGNLSCGQLSLRQCHNHNAV